MNLPYPFEHRGRLVAAVDVRSPTGGTLADARRAVGDGNDYVAVHVYVSGSVAALYGPDGEPIGNPKDVLKDLPYFLAEWVAFKSLVMSGASDEVDVSYTCPRCGREFEGGEPVKVSELEVRESKEPPEVLVPIEQAVTFQDAKTGEVIESISSLSFRLPTLADCIRCGNKGISDDTRLQYAIWGEAITKVNSNEVNQIWKGAYGALAFERMAMMDVNRVAKAISEWSIDNTVQARCPKCKKVFREEVPTGSFFASALGAR
jgi:DNA-directed RNA polymerase subunit RPC12/RpoP